MAIMKSETGLWTSPFSFMRRFTEEMDRLFEDFGSRREGLVWPSEAWETGWRPDMDVFEKDGYLVVRADLPGLTKDDVKVDVTDETLTIRGERKSEHKDKAGSVYRTERSYGSFYRVIPLPEGVSVDTVDATFHDGVLEVSLKLPARAKIEPRHVEIKALEEGKARTKIAA